MYSLLISFFAPKQLLVPSTVQEVVLKPVQFLSSHLCLFLGNRRILYQPKKASYDSREDECVFVVPIFASMFASHAFFSAVSSLEQSL